MLVTNDDGIDSEGLRTLAAAAVAAGLEVYVAAPATEHSGMSAALSSLQDDGRLVLDDRRLAGVDARRAVAVQATPAFIAFSGVKGAFGAVPDLVLSGVNEGPNTGSAVLHSGTVGAALTAATHGVPAIAFSMASGRVGHWATAGAVARRVLSWLDGAPEPVVLNVNVPDVGPGELRGLREARLAPYGAVQARVADVGGAEVRLSIDETPPGVEQDSDAVLLSQGWATVTALRAPCEAPAVDLSGLADR